MEHPFINDLSKKSLEELQTDISNLTSKLNFAYRSNHGPLINQIQMALESYRNAYTKKMDELIKKQNIQTQVVIDKKSK
jgi:hypothetical protein